MINKNIIAYVQMKIVEQHIISKSHKAYAFFDKKSVLSNNLFNAAMRHIAYVYANEKRYCNFYEADHTFIEKNVPEYRALASNVSQQIMMQVDRCWKSYFNALKEYEKNPSKFKGEPKPPREKTLPWQRNMLVYTQRVIGAPGLREGKIVLHQTDTGITTRLRNVNQVIVVPLNTGQYKVILIYEKCEEPKIQSDIYAGCDIGVNNLMTVGYNDKKAKPFIISGKPLKSANQYYNKRLARLKSKLPEGRKTSKQIRKLTHKRNMKVCDYVHKASNKAVGILKRNGVSKIVIGYNPEWKQKVCLGKRNNQNFVSIPFLKAVNAVSYKCGLAGIEAVTREESYTSKSSFLDLEPIRKKEKYAGRRVRRGLYVSSDGTRINADLNSAYNILRKEIPDAFVDGIEGIAVCPVRIALAN